MTFLPIVDRELRLAARRRGTFWLRVVAGAVALIVASGELAVFSVLPSNLPWSLGKMLFSNLSWLAAFAALSAGLFFTADCLSEEKREGTLGFLFLTDLRSYDVVLGKLAATSLRCVFALLAIFPILGVTLLLGGVTPVEFWRTLVALGHALFFSLATGMLVSSISRRGQAALLGTALALLAWIIVTQLLDRILGSLRGRATFDFFGLCSPLRVLDATDASAGRFTRALLFGQVAAWAQLALACVLIRRTWQDREDRAATPLAPWRQRWRYGGATWRRARRFKLLGQDPILWLASRERWQGWFIRLLTLLACGGFVAMILSDPGPQIWFLSNLLSFAINCSLYLAVASQSCQFFADARQTRMVELLLAAPLSTKEIVNGAWLALVRLFGGPVLLLLALHPLLGLVSVWNQSSFRSGPFGGEPWLQVLEGLLGSLNVLANLAALAWFGMWMGLVSRNAIFATLKTLAVVRVAPAFVVTIASGILVPLLLLPTLVKNSSASATVMTSAYPLLSTGVTLVLSLTTNWIFWRLARRKLLDDFRAQATQVVAPIVRARPPMIPVRPSPV